MKTDPTNLATAAQEFFAACHAHDVEGMTALFADGARGRYAPYGRESVVPICGGVDVIEMNLAELLVDGGFAQV